MKPKNQLRGLLMDISIIEVKTVILTSRCICFVLCRFYLNDIHPKSTFIPRHGLIISDESL